MKFVLSTLHFAGLGFALRLKEVGHDVVLAAAGTEGRNFIVARDDTFVLRKMRALRVQCAPEPSVESESCPTRQDVRGARRWHIHTGFSTGVGASITLYMDHPVHRKAVECPERVARNIYLFVVYREGEQLLTAGYYRDALLLACAFGYTIPTAWEAALAVAASVRCPGRAYRLDGAGTDYPSSPLRRYEALTAMGYL